MSVFLAITAASLLGAALGAFLTVQGVSDMWVVWMTALSLFWLWQGWVVHIFCTDGDGLFGISRW